MARFGDKSIIGKRALTGAKLERVGGSLWREGNYRERSNGGSKITVGGSVWREGRNREM